MFDADALKFDKAGGGITGAVTLVGSSLTVHGNAKFDSRVSIATVPSQSALTITGRTERDGWYSAIELRPTASEWGQGIICSGNDTWDTSCGYSWSRSSLGSDPNQEGASIWAWGSDATATKWDLHFDTNDNAGTGPVVTRMKIMSYGDLRVFWRE